MKENAFSVEEEVQPLKAAHRFHWEYGKGVGVRSGASTENTHQCLLIGQVLLPFQPRTFHHYLVIKNSKGALCTEKTHFTSIKKKQVGIPSDIC